MEIRQRDHICWVSHCLFQDEYLSYLGSYTFSFMKKPKTGRANNKIKPKIMNRAKLIENPRASKSDAPRIENLKALII